jgi:hypothetical protein
MTEEPKMTDEMTAFRSLLEKSPAADLLRETIGFAAQRLMELEVEADTGGRKERRAAGSAQTAIDSGTGRPASGPWNCGAPSCARARTSRSSWSPDGSREGADGVIQEGLHPGRLDPLSERSGRGHWHDRDL